MNFKIGFGYDVHRLEKGHELIIGGIKIPTEKGCVAHSDGDVLIHAIIDSMLGAANMRDIGYHFPDSDNTYKNIDSKILLKKTLKLINSENWKINNIDCTVCLQAPKLSPHIEKMKTVLAEILSIASDQISVKATTTEKLGFVGKGLGISAYSVCMLMPKHNQNSQLNN